MFQKLELKSLKELESLKNNEEWENFTIAFYGETGAGKSTLIECLRLFFKERSKVVHPYDLGVEHWLKHKEEFQKLSHIKTLQDAIQKKIEENGGKLTIIGRS